MKYLLIIAIMLSNVCFAQFKTKLSTNSDSVLNLVAGEWNYTGYHTLPVMSAAVDEKLLKRTPNAIFTKDVVIINNEIYTHPKYELDSVFIDMPFYLHWEYNITKPIQKLHVITIHGDKEKHGDHYYNHTTEILVLNDTIYFDDQGFILIFGDRKVGGVN